jgi:ABC-type antimicrobial peptide transport system permease subunit
MRAALTGPVVESKQGWEVFLTNSRVMTQATGSKLWPLRYAVSSLGNQRTRNAGIALLLAFGVALPTTVFAWTSTAVYLTVDSHFSENVYQIKATVQDPYYLQDLRTIASGADSYDYVERIDYVVSTAGVLRNENSGSWFVFSPEGWSARKDCRVFPITNERLDLWRNEFEWIGNATLTAETILVSDYFISLADRLYGQQIGIGSVLSIDVITDSDWRAGGIWTPSTSNATFLENKTVAGIYSMKSLLTHLGDSFPSIRRSITETSSLPAIGITDSIMILEECLDEAALERLRNGRILDSNFTPVALLRGSIEQLLESGAENTQRNMLGVVQQILEAYPTVDVRAVRELERLDSLIETYLRSQILTILAIPILFTSIFVTIFTAESSITRREGEVSVLRARGASFNQIISSIMWESILLSMLGFALGITLTVLLTPIMGSSTSLLNVDLVLFSRFLAHLAIPIEAWMIAIVITMYLPGVYLIHIQNTIDVTEIGQPVKSATPEQVVDTRFFRFALGFLLLLLFLLLMPFFMEPFGVQSSTQILIVTLVLFAAAYTGSRVMQITVSKLSSAARPAIGERTLYVVQSLRRRRSRFMPLLIILTLSLTTTTMMLMESSTFEATLLNEVDYAIGADLRIETSSSLPLDFADELVRYRQIAGATPIMRKYAVMGSYRFYLIGVRSLEYRNIGRFSPDSFVGEDSNTLLTQLYETRNGIIVSDRWADSLNKSIGDVIQPQFESGEFTIRRPFEIIGFVRSAPGLGFASSQDAHTGSVVSALDYQIGQGGFALVNDYYLRSSASLETADVFLASANMDSTFSGFCEALGERYRVQVVSPHLAKSEVEYDEVQHLISGIRGLTTIGSILCAAMAIAAIGLFFGSAILERKPEYAIFRALGATRRQVGSIVVSEFAGLIVSVIAVSLVLGFMFGQAMSVLVFTISPIELVLPAVFTIPVVITAVVLVIEWAVMLSACFFPARAASSVSMVEELRNL